MTRFAAVASGLALASALMTNNAFAEDIRFAHFFPATTPTAKTDAEFARLVEERTNGAVKTQFFWAGAMGKATEILGLVGSGSVEMGATLPNYFPAELPFASLGAVPLTYFPDPETALTVEHAVTNGDPAGQAELRTANVESLLVHALRPYHLECTKPIEKITDLDGTKIRTFGAFAPGALQSFGAIPVNLQPAEIYEGLQRGVVDCVMYNYDFAAASKLQEVAKYWTDISFGSFAGYHIFANRDFMAGLPAETADTIRRTAKEVEAAELGKLVEAENAAIDTAKAAGVTFVRFTEQAEFQKQLPDTLDAWAKQMIDKGVKADDVERLAAQVRSMSGR